MPCRRARGRQARKTSASRAISRQRHAHLSSAKKTKENLEADDKGVELGPELLGGLRLDEVALGHGGDEGGVEPAGEEDPERDVSHEPLDNRLQPRTGIGHMAVSVSVTAVLLVFAYHRSTPNNKVMSHTSYLLEGVSEDERLVRRRPGHLLLEPLRVVPPPEPAGGAGVEVARREDLEPHAVLVQGLHLGRDPDGTCMQPRKKARRKPIGQLTCVSEIVCTSCLATALALSDVRTGSA